MSMSRNQSCLTAVAASLIICAGAANAQAPASPPAAKPAPTAAAPAQSKPSTATQVEAWSKKQWEAAKKEWSTDKAKWADCRKQSSRQKLAGRKSWSFLYKCMSD
jgi:hypothetical protein